MFPLPFVENLIKKLNIKTIVIIILSIVLFTIAIFISPKSEDVSNNETHSINSSEQSNAYTENGALPPQKESESTVFPTEGATEETPSINNTPSNNKKDDMVWISSSGKKYHSKSTCSNMNSPKQITMEDAQKQGYEPCQKCH